LEAIENKLNDKSKADVFMKPNLETNCDDYFLFPFRWRSHQAPHALVRNVSMPFESGDFLSHLPCMRALSSDDARAMANRLIYQTELIRGNEVTD
jgi:hypothetical protein